MTVEIVILDSTCVEECDVVDVKMPQVAFSYVTEVPGLCSVDVEVLEVFDQPVYVGCATCKKKYPEVGATPDV
jgi:hypothetical protein